MKRNLESGSCFLMNYCNSFLMLCEILPRYSSLKVKWLQVWVWILGCWKNFLFKNCLMHLSMNLEGYSFLVKVVLVDWNSESIFRYELQIVKTQHNVSFLALTMAPDVSRNVRPSIFSCILAVLFVIKLLTYSQLYRLLFVFLY